MRDIIQLINSILLFVPPEEQETIQNFQAIAQSAAFTAPEIMKLRWGELQEAIGNCVPKIDENTPEWKKTVACLFSTIPRHQIETPPRKEEATTSD